VLVRATIAVLVSTACVGGVTPTQCAVDGECGAQAFCAQGTCIDGTRTCPTLQPRFSSINASLLRTGCGARQISCHSADSSASGGGPSFAGNPYANLVNAPAANRLGTAGGLILVKPNDPADSFLVTKLTTTDNVQFGPTQPANAPGSICAASVEAIRQWILAGAPDD
jgi:hypothetical protein